MVVVTLRASLSGTFLHGHSHTRASLSGTFLHSHSHAPSVPFRHLPPQSLTHSERRFPAPSSTVTHTLRASLSGTFLHSHSHTLSIAFRHLPPDSPTHSEHRFPAPSSTVTHTLRASLSGTFLQTLPDLVTPLKGHSLSPRSCPPTRSAASQRFRY